MKLSPYYMTPTGLARVRAEAKLMGQRLKAMRSARVLEQTNRIAARESVRAFLADVHERASAARLLP